MGENVGTRFRSPGFGVLTPLFASALVVLAVMAAGCGHSGGSSGTVWRLATASGRVLSHVRVKGTPCALSVSGNTGWVTEIGGGALYRVGASSARAARIPGRPCGVAAGLGAVWVGSDRDVLRVPPGRPVASGSSAGLGNLLVDSGAVWAADLDGDVLRLRGNRLSRVKAIGETEQLAALGGGIWAIAAGPGELVRIDERTLTVRRFRIGLSPKAIATGDGAVWVALTDRRLLRFDPARRRASLVARLPDAPILLAAGRGFVWSMPAAGRLSRTAEDTGRVEIVRAFGRRPFGLALGRDALWVGTR